MEVKFVSYDGAWPGLCFGTLVVEVDGVRYEIEGLNSGGSVSFDADWQEEVTSGPWGVSNWPDDFPEEAKSRVVQLVNDNVPEGCCGGCV